VRVAFLGNAPWSVPTVEALSTSQHRLMRVVTRVPRPAGRGTALTPTPVARAARRLRAPLAEVETVKAGSGFEALAAEPFDVLVVVAYGEILPGAVLALPRIAPLNLHFSLLPELRGAAPVQRALLQGLPVTGVTTIRMDEGMDTGPILLQQEEPIRPTDDAGALGERLAAMGARLVVDTIDRLQSGTAQERAQDDAMATYAPKLRPEERVIEWSAGAEQVDRQIRAMAPEPGAITTFRGRNLKVLRASVRDGSFQGTAAPPAGVLFGLSTESGPRPAVGTGGHDVVILEAVVPEGRRHMSGEEFLRGYPPGPGELVG
jgi:methionyl-tRNA formyltransferase